MPLSTSCARTRFRHRDCGLCTVHTWLRVIGVLLDRLSSVVLGLGFRRGRRPRHVYGCGIKP
jgi:hypothetical protein